MKHKLKPLQEQVMVITGASSGIGLATAALAAERGASLVLVARSGEVLERVAQDIGSAGAQVMHVVADVADRAAVFAAAEAAVQRFGRIDTWLNDAAISMYGRLDEVDEVDSRRLFDIDFWGVVNGSLAALPHLRRQGGALINMGSEVSDAVVPPQGMYSAAKHAVKGWTDALRIEIEQLDGAPVSITLIQPTAVNTPFPHHARNYMAQEPKLPTPMIDPFHVAEAILKAATEGGRDVKVGALSHLNTAMAKLLPRIGDRMAARQTHRQQEREPARHPQGALHAPSNDGRIHGKAP
jgi:short-subunit dehydrogenase